MICALTGVPHRLFWMRSALWGEDCKQKIETCCERGCPSAKATTASDAWGYSSPTYSAAPECRRSIIATLIGMSTWREIAQRKRPAEDLLIDRYRTQLIDWNRSRYADDPDATINTPWGLGHRFETGLYITDFHRRSAWPETQLVLDVFWDIHPDRRFIVMKGIWPPGRIHEPEPPENKLFYTNLWESMVTRASRWLRVQPGPVVYFIWSSPVDLDDPPASGNPPQELLAARAETANIKSHWLGS